MSTFIKHLSSFWRDIFADRDILETLYRATQFLFAEILQQHLHTAASAALVSTPVWITKQGVPLSITLDKLRAEPRDTGVVWVFELGDHYAYIGRLKNSPNHSTVILESGIDYSVEWNEDTEKYSLVFESNPFDVFDPILISKEPEIVLQGFDGISFGDIPSGMLAFYANYDEAKNAQQLSRRTFYIRGTEKILDNVTIEGGGYHVRAAAASFRDNDIGKTLYANDGRAALIVGLLNAYVCIVDTDLSGVTALELRRVSNFQDNYAGFELILLNEENPAASGIYSVTSALNDTSLELDRAVEHADKLRYVAEGVSRAGLIFTLPSSSRVNSSFVGKHVFITDGADTSDWFVVGAVGSRNARGFYETITVLDPNHTASSFAATGLYAGFSDRAHQYSGLQWGLRSPRAVPTVRVFAYDVKEDLHTLSRRYGRAVGRTATQSSEAYKNLLLGVYQYYWSGPTVRALQAALEAMTGSPVILSEDELLLRVETRYGIQYVITSENEYPLPEGGLRQDLADTANWRSYVFRRYENLTENFTIEDSGVSDGWFYGASIPQSIIPTDTRRIAEPRISALTVGSDWNIGDVGVRIGCSYTGFPCDAQACFDLSILGDVVTTSKTIFRESDVGKYLYIAGEYYEIAALNNPREVLLADIPIVSSSFFTAISNASDVITVNGILFSEADLGRALILNSSTPAFSETVYIADVIINHNGTQVRVVDASGDSAPIPTSNSIIGAAALYGEILRSNPTRQNYATAVMASGAGRHVFQVTYNANTLTGTFDALQRDIQNIINEGRPIHTLVLNSPLGNFSDTAYFSDTFENLTFMFEESLSAMSRTLYFGDHWTLGDYIAPALHNARWMRRFHGVELEELPTSPTDAAGYVRHNVWQLDSATEGQIYVEAADSTPGGVYDVNLYIWNSVGWSLHHTLTVDTAAATQHVMPLLPAAYYAIVVAEYGGSDIADVGVLLGGREVSPIHHRHSVNTPVLSGVTIAGQDLFTTSSTVFSFDVGTIGVLEYTGVSEVCIVYDVTSANILRLRTLETMTSHSAGATGSATFKFLCHAGWGQTPVRIGQADLQNAVRANSAPAVRENPVFVTIEQ